MTKPQHASPPDMQFLSEMTVGGLHEALLPKLPRLANNARILDVGCGTCAFLTRLHALGFESLWGIDNVRQPDWPKFIHCVQGNLDWDDLTLGMRFELICAIEILEHLENPGRLFRFVTNHLSEGGYFLLTTPNIHSVYARLKFFLGGHLMQFDRKGDPTHLFPVVLFTLPRLLARHNLVMDQVWTHPPRGMKACRWASRLASRMLGSVLWNAYPGYNLCFIIRKPMTSSKT